MNPATHGGRVFYYSLWSKCPGIFYFRHHSCHICRKADSISRANARASISGDWRVRSRMGFAPSGKVLKICGQTTDDGEIFHLRPGNRFRQTDVGNDADTSTTDDHNSAPKLTRNAGIGPVG